MDKNKDNVSLRVWSNNWKMVKEKIIPGKPIKALCKVNIHKGNYMLVLNSIEKVGQ